MRLGRLVAIPDGFSRTDRRSGSQGSGPGDTVSGPRGYSSVG